MSKSNEYGRVKLPTGKTVNDQAKDRAEYVNLGPALDSIHAQYVQDSRKPDIDVGREALRSHVLTLVEYLEEAHEVDRRNYVNGRSHSGDGAAGCSYCSAIRAAREALKKY